MAEQNPSLILSSLVGQNTKTHIEFDGNGRPEFVYQAVASAKDGEPCMVTQYVYTNIIGSTIKATKEANSVWQDTWDVDFSI